MANPCSNKKKIRGWKRKIKQIERWKLRCLHLDHDELQRFHRDYAKLWIDPFYRLNRRNPPLWYSRLLLRAMLEVYDSWHRELTAMQEPFYLKIWLYHPHFINSQIVAAVSDNIGYYDGIFDKGTRHKNFPLGVVANRDLLEDFTRELHRDSHHYWLSELQEDIELGYKTEEQVEALKKRAYKSETLELGHGTDQVFSIQVGDVWVGERIQLNKAKEKGAM